MVRETRHLWVGNLPDDIREEKLKEHFARYGRVESAKLTGKRDADGSQSAFVDFVDINSATKAHDASAITIGERDCPIEYNNPDSPSEIHPGETSREYDLPGRRYDNRRGGNLEDRYDTANSNYEFDRSYGPHYGRENSQYRDDTSSSPAYRERQRERTRSKNSFYSHSRSSDQYENDPTNYLKENNYPAENFGDVSSLRKSRHKPFKALPAGQSKSPSARSGSGSGRKSKSNSRSRSQSRSKSTGSQSSDTGSEHGWSRSHSRDSDHESHNSDETTQSSMGGSKFAGLCVRNLPARSSDSSIKDGLFHEFKKYGQVTAVTVQDSGKDRKGIVFFKRAEDMEKAMEASRGNSFFGCEMSLSVWDGADIDVVNSEVKYFEKELDEFHPRATRTLFVGNLDRSVSKEELNEVFHKFGEIVHIEIKKPAGAQPFAFLQFSDIDSVVRARKKLDGEYVGKNKLGFGKSMATNCVWLDNLSPLVTDKFLMQFCSLRFGEVSRVVHDRRTNMALVFFINIDDSQKAVQDLKNLNVKGRRPKVDFASRECQNHFYDRMEHTGQAQYYNHSRETSPNYPERKFTKTPSGDYSRGVNFNSATFEPRRASRSQSSSSFTKYSGNGGNPPGTYDDRYPYPRGEDGYHERPPYKETFPTPIRSGSYEDDDYQHALSEYSYHQKERTKELFRDRSGSTSPTRHERSGSHHKSLEPVEDEISPAGSDEEGGLDSPTRKRKWNSLMVPSNKDGASIPRSPFAEDPEEPSWKTRNGGASSERSSPLDRSDSVRKSKLAVDISRDDSISVEHKKIGQPKASLDKIPRDMERLKGSEVHSDLENDACDLLQVDGEKDTWVDKLKDKRSPHSDFVSEKASLKPGIDSCESGVSSQHDGEAMTLEANEVSPREDMQKKLEARKQRFSDNSPIDIQKLRKERHLSPGKAPLMKGAVRDNREYIPKCESFMGDSRTVEDSHSGDGIGAEPPDPGDGSASCKHNDKIESFWWIPKSQRSYSAEDERTSDAAETAQSAEEGAQTHAASSKPKKSDTSLTIPQDRSTSQTLKKSSPVGSIGQRLERIPHLLRELEGEISDQDGVSGEPSKPISAHSSQGQVANDNPAKDFEKPLDSSRLHPRGNRPETEMPRGKIFDSRQRHPSIGEGDGKDRKVGDEKAKGFPVKRKEYHQGTIIQEMVWKMIPLDPIVFPPSGRKEQIDAIYKSMNSTNLPKEDALVRDLRMKQEESESKAAGGPLDCKDQYSNSLTLTEAHEGDGFRTDADQLPLLSPKPGTTRAGNAVSPQTSAPPHLSPAGTPAKIKEDITGVLQEPAKPKILLDPLFKKSSNVTLDAISSLNESSYLRHGENKVTSWLRQMPSPVPVTLENDPRDRTAFLMVNKTGSPVTPSTPSTPTTPNDARHNDVLPTKTIVDRLSHCRIVRKNRNSIDMDSRQDRNHNDDLIKYFQNRMKENSIFGSDEARLSSEPKSSMLTKSKSEDTGGGSTLSLNRSNSDPRMNPAAKLTSPKEIGTSVDQGGGSILTQPPEKDSSVVGEAVSTADNKTDAENSNAVDSAAPRVPENDISPAMATKDPPLRSILKKRGKSTEETDNPSDPIRKAENGQESEHGLKRKRSPSPPSVEGKKPEKISIPSDSSEKKPDASASLPTTPKFQHPTNMLLTTPSNKKKLAVKLKPKVNKGEKPTSSVPASAKKSAEKTSTPAKKTANIPKKDTAKQTSENTPAKGKAAASLKEKSGPKPSVKKSERKDERRESREVEKTEKGGEEKRQLERKSSSEKNEGKRGEKSDEKNVKKVEEKSLDRKSEDGLKREEKKVNTKGDKKQEDKKQDDKKQSDAKVDEVAKKSAKKPEDKKFVKDSRKGEEKKASDRKNSDKKSSEKKSEDKKPDVKRAEEKRPEKNEEGKRMMDKKGDSSKGTDRKIDDKKEERKTSAKGEKASEDRKGSDKKNSDGKKEKNKAVEEKKNVEKKIEDKKQVEKKGDKKSMVSSSGKKKSEKERQKEPGKASEKVVQRKIEEKCEAKSLEKPDKEKSKAKKLQKSDSADAKPKKAPAKDTGKSRSKSEDKPKSTSNQATKSSSSGRKATKRVEKLPNVASPGKEDAHFGSGGKGGGVRALMDWMDSDSSESEDEFDNLIFEQPSSSAKPKPSKAPAAIKKNVIFSSSDDSDSIEEMPKPPSRQPQRQVLQRLYESLSESEDDVNEKDVPAFPPVKHTPRIHSDLSSSSEDEEPAIKRRPPPKKVQPKKRKIPPTKTGKKSRELPVEVKKRKFEDHSERETERESEKDSDEEEMKPRHEGKKGSSKKAESRTPAKSKTAKGKVKREVKGNNASTKKVEDKVERNATPKGKGKKAVKGADKSNKTAARRNTKVVEPKESDHLSNSSEEETIPVIPVVKPTKAQGKKGKKTNSRSKKGKAQPVHEPEVSEEVLETINSKMSESETHENIDEDDVPSLEKASLPETDLEVSLDLPVVQHEEVVEESQVEDLIIQDYETEEIVTEKTIEKPEDPVEADKTVEEPVEDAIEEPVEEPVEEASPAPPPPPTKQTKAPKRKKGKHRHNRRMKKTPPQVEPTPVPEIKITTDQEEDTKEETILEEVKEKQAETEEEPVRAEKDTKPEPSTQEEEDCTTKLLGEHIDAEKEAAMFEETAEATAALVFEETAEATAALEMVEIEQERQRVLEEEIFGESTPLEQSPNVPSTPSPAPILQPLTPRPASPEEQPQPLPHESETERMSEAEPCVTKQETGGEEMVKQEAPASPMATVEEQIRGCDVKGEKLQEPVIVKEELSNEPEPPQEVKSDIPLPEEAPQSEETEGTLEVVTKNTAVVIKQEVDQIPSEEKTEESVPKQEPTEEPDASGQTFADKEAPEVKVPVGDGTACTNDLEDHSIIAATDAKLEVKLTDIATPGKLPDSGLEQVKFDLDGAEETASVELTTETASEANESLVVVPDAVELPVPSEAVREKLPEPPQTPHKSKKKKEHKKKKHKDKKSSKKDGSRRDKKQRREKKQKRHKSSKDKEERRKRRQRKAERHRSVSGSSFSDMHGMDSKGLEVMQGQATAASMVPISQPGGLQIQKVENQQAYPFGQQQEQWYHQVDHKGFFQPYPQMEGLMKPPMINPHLGPTDGSMSPLQTISPKDIQQQPLRIIGVGPKEDVKLIDPYYYPSMQTNNPSQMMSLLSPKVRHPSGKEGSEGLGHQLPAEGAMAMPQTEKPGVELVSGNQPPKETTGPDHPSNDTERPKTAVTEEQRSKGNDVYEFNEEDPTSTPDAPGNPQKSTSDPYEFQESPGPASSKTSPSRAASRGRLRPRPGRGARTRSNSKGAAKSKEEGSEVPEEIQSTENIVPKTEGATTEVETKASVAELVPVSTESRDMPPKSEGGVPLAMQLSMSSALAGLIPRDALPLHTDKQQMASYTDHIRMIANVASASTSMASVLQNKPSTTFPSQSSITAPSVVAALSNPPSAKMQPPLDVRPAVPLSQQQPPQGAAPTKKRAGKNRGKDKSMTSMPPYQLQYPPPHPHQQAIRNSTQSSAEAVEMHFEESLRRQHLQQMTGPRMPGQALPQPPGGAGGLPTGTSCSSISREAPAITSQLIGPQSFGGSRSPAVAVAMKNGPHTIASVPGSQTSPDTSIPGVSRSGMHPNLPSTLVSGPGANRQPTGITKYECRVPTSVAAVAYSDASVLRARLMQNDPKLRGEDGKMLMSQPSADGHGPGAFLHPSGVVERIPAHNEEKSDHQKLGDRIVPTEQRLPAAYDHPPIVFVGARPGDMPLRGPLPPGMFPEQGPGMQGLPLSSLVHQAPYGIPGFPGPFPPRMIHPMVHAEQNQSLASPRAMPSPRMVAPNTSSPRLSPKIKSPGLGHGDRTAQTPDKQAELHNIALRHSSAPPGITTGIPPPGKDHPHRGMIPGMMKGDLDKEERQRQQMNHLPGHGLPPHIQQLPAQSIPDHSRTTPIPHPERGSPGSRTPGPDGRTQVPLNTKQWPQPGMPPHTALPTLGAATSAMDDNASVMLLMRYPVMWQGMLALKQEIATIQLHFICGNKVVANDALKMAYPPLRIAQRMRLEDSQLEGVARRMRVTEESVVLLALPCGSDQDEVLSQTSAMRSGLISYLREKQAAGIINVGPPGCTNPSYVIHIFPPCEFTQRSLSHKAPDLLESVMNLAYMMFVIATC